MKYAAKVGFSVSSTSSSTSNLDKGLEFKDNLAWLYWIGEILLAMFVAAGIPFSAARQPFDENAGQWYAKPQVIAITSTKSRKALMQALKGGSFQEAGSLLTTQQIKYPRIELCTRRSPDPASTQDIVLIVNHLQRKGRASEIKRGMVTPSELDTLRRAINTAAPAAT